MYKRQVQLQVSGSIIKNVKSVIVPNTGHLKGMEAAVAAGIIAGSAEKMCIRDRYKFAAQWQAVKAYANKKDVQILGDIPIYVSADSVDAWVGGCLLYTSHVQRYVRPHHAGPH